MKQPLFTVTQRVATPPAEATTKSTACQVVRQQDLDSSVVGAQKQRNRRSTPKISCTGDKPDFVEGHEDPAQSQELERQQDA